MENYTTEINTNATFNFSVSSTGSPIYENGTTHTLHENLEYFELHKTIQQFFTWCLVVMVAMALAGNILIIIVMTREQNRNSSTAAFFVALSVSDLMVIVFGPFDRLLIYITKYNVVTSIDLTTFKTIMLYASVNISSWMIVFLTVERAISVTVPHKVKAICVNKMKIILIVATCLVFLIYNTIVYSVFLDFVFIQDGDIYLDTEENIPGTYLLTLWIDACLTFFAPVVFLIIGSIYIIIRVKLSGSGMRRNTPQNTSYVTKILLASVLVFILTMSPYYVFTFIVNDKISDKPYLSYILSDVCFFLIDMNSALNFYVYFLAGTKFRKDVRDIFCRCRNRSAMNSSDTFSSNIYAPTNAVSSIQTS